MNEKFKPTDTIKAPDQNQETAASIAQDIWTKGIGSFKAPNNADAFSAFSNSKSINFNDHADPYASVHDQPNSSEPERVHIKVRDQFGKDRDDRARSVEASAPPKSDGHHDSTESHGEKKAHHFKKSDLDRETVDKARDLAEFCEKAHAVVDKMDASITAAGPYVSRVAKAAENAETLHKTAYALGRISDTLEIADHYKVAPAAAAVFTAAKAGTEVYQGEYKKATKTTVVGVSAIQAGLTAAEIGTVCGGPIVGAGAGIVVGAAVELGGDKLFDKMDKISSDYVAAKKALSEPYEPIHFGAEHLSPVKIRTLGE